MASSQHRRPRAGTSRRTIASSKSNVGSSTPDSRRYESFSPFRSWAFDACVFIALDCRTYDVVRAVEIPMTTVKAIARETRWVNGHRVSVGQIAGPIEGARDATGLIRDALEALA